MTLRMKISLLRDLRRRKAPGGDRDFQQGNTCYRQTSSDSDTRMKIYPPPFYFANTVKTIIFDIADRKIANNCGSRTGGYYVSSRKIGSSSTWWPTGRSIITISCQKEQKSGTFLRDTATNSEFTSIDLVDIRYFPGFTRPNYLLIAGLDLARPDEQVRHTFLGAGDNIYASWKTFT